MLAETKAMMSGGMMSGQQHTSVSGEGEGRAATVSSATPHARWRSPLRSTHRRRIFWYVLILTLFAVITLFTLTMESVLLTGAFFPIGHGAMGSVSTPSSTVIVRVGKIYLYNVFPINAGLMLPSVDHRGNVWFGEMATNRLARLDPRTGTVTTWIPPKGEDGIMGIAIDEQGSVWFAEQNANYIGCFDPVGQTFRTFSLGSSKSQRVGLEDLQFDSSGKLWFTETVAGRIGRLDPASGAIQTWALPISSSGTHSYPLGLAVTHNRQVWFGTYSGGVVGHLDPATGRLLLSHLANPAEQIYSMATDDKGRIWYTELQFGKLGMIDTTTGKITERAVPAVLGNPEDLHSIVVVNGSVWFTSSGANALVRYSPEDNSFAFYRLPVPDSIPFGLTLSSANTLWFTAGGNPVNCIGKMTIPS